jgi:hypothetical protein
LNGCLIRVFLVGFVCSLACYDFGCCFEGTTGTCNHPPL